MHFCGPSYREAVICSLASVCESPALVIRICKNDRTLVQYALLSNRVQTHITFKAEGPIHQGPPPTSLRGSFLFLRFLKQTPSYVYKETANFSFLTLSGLLLHDHRNTKIVSVRLTALP